MRRIELQTKIQQLLEAAPDGTLWEVLHFLETAKDLDADALQKAHNLRRILEEDRELLQKLAQ